MKNYYYFNEDRCVMCGDIIPEGRQVCTYCEEKAHSQKEAATTAKTGPYHNLSGHLRRLFCHLFPGSRG